MGFLSASTVRLVYLKVSEAIVHLVAVFAGKGCGTAGFSSMMATGWTAPWKSQDQMIGFFLMPQHPF